MSEPFKDVAVDVVRPLLRAKGGYRFVLSYIDLATRWPEAVPLNAASAQEVCEQLLHIVSMHGIPSWITSDQGKPFIVEGTKQLFVLLGVEQHLVAPYRPEGNGTVERFHGTLKLVPTNARLEGIDWVSMPLQP